jgi:hypothetical protein
VSDAVKRKRLGSHRGVIGTLVHGTGTISRSFLDKVASNYRANADGENAVRRTRQHGQDISAASNQSLIQHPKYSPTPCAA